MAFPLLPILLFAAGTALLGGASCALRKPKNPPDPESDPCPDQYIPPGQTRGSSSCIKSIPTVEIPRVTPRPEMQPLVQGSGINPMDPKTLLSDLNLEVGKLHFETFGMNSNFHKKWGENLLFKLDEWQLPINPMDAGYHKILEKVFTRPWAENAEIIRRAAQILSKNSLKVRKLELLVHTDSLGPEKLNLEISDLRARIFHKLLKINGAPTDGVLPMGMGESHLLVPEVGTAQERLEARLANRRIEFKFVE